ncbi:unnamed protein product, partial [Oikopleura dioica]
GRCSTPAEYGAAVVLLRNPKL